MKTLLAAAFGLTVLAATPALAFDPIYNSPYNSNNWSTYGAYAGPGYGYRPAWGWDDHAWRSGATQIAVCPPGYHLGRRARLCWPD